MAVQASFSTDGIKKLMEAEQEAQKIVAEARKFKTERLKQAKAEADKEIAAYRAEREGAYQKKLADSSSGSTSTFQRLSQETQMNITNLQNSVRAKKQAVLTSLLGYVATVKFVK
jgi:V-type H+-transporting ATPase subunit G